MKISNLMLSVLLFTFMGTSHALPDLQTIAASTYILRSLCDLIKYVKPSYEEQYRSVLIEERLAILRAEKELVDCLVEHALDEKNSLGIPAKCNDVAFVFALWAGSEASGNIENEFKNTMNKRAK